mgnify:CR=1 FL=1
MAYATTEDFESSLGGQFQAIYRNNRELAAHDLTRSFVATTRRIGSRSGG